eukprot:PITA_18884
MAIPIDPVANERYEEAMAKAKCIILDGIKDHVVLDIAEKEMAKKMWNTLKTLYQLTFVQRRMLLENQLRATPDQELMVRTTLNAISEDWETFVQSILARTSLPDWEELWVDLRQEEIRWLTKARSSDKGVRIKKEEEEDVALASMGKQDKRKKKDLSKVKCFHCGELGNYAN